VQLTQQLCHAAYRDLIDGTDIIIDISTKCHSILDSILAIQVRMQQRVCSLLQKQDRRQQSSWLSKTNSGVNA
jgi:hypothetical protein